MNLRHLQAFIAVAEELHFGRAAKRLHIGQSPLSRTIRALEAHLKATLFRRTPHSACLTCAGQAFLQEARRILLTIDQAQSRVRAVAAGHQGVLRIALSGDIGRTRLAALLALCRQEAPQVRLQLSDVPFKELMHGLGADLFDAGFAVAGDVEDGIVAAPVWQAPMVVALPAGHPMRAFKEVPLAEVRPARSRPWPSA